MEKSLITEIEKQAAYSTTDILELLRLAHIAATKLKQKEFDDWIGKEINGYGPQDDIPPYRYVHCDLKWLNITRN